MTCANSNLTQKILQVLIPREFHIKQLCEVRPLEGHTVKEDANYGEDRDRDRP